MKKEKDKMSKQRLEEVRRELAGINETLTPLLAEYKKCEPITGSAQETLCMQRVLGT